MAYGTENLVALLCRDRRSAVVTHDTNTIVEAASATAVALADHGQELDFAVVFTGAEKPERFRGSDASFNVGFALGALQGVGRCMQSDQS